MTRKIAIVGGGYIGARLAKALEGKADVTLVEQRSNFVHTPAMIRAVVRPGIVDEALIPYDKLLTRGRLVQARAESVDGGEVTLEGGERVAADWVVVATGSANATPFKAMGDDIEGFRAANARVHGMLEAAGSVAIVGAGPVGTELAGEIAHFMPGKTVTLISDRARLFPGQPESFGRALAAKLAAAGVEVILGARAENLESLTEPYAGSVKLSDGREVSADLIFPVIGSRASSELLEALPGVEKSGANRVKVDRWMRPSSLPNVFAAGDVADAGDAMTIVAVERQLPWLKKALAGLVAGKAVEDLRPYKPWGTAPIFVPLGPKKGNSFMFLTFGDLVTRLVKGKGMFISKYRKAFGRA